MWILVWILVWIFRSGILIFTVLDLPSQPLSISGQEDDKTVQNLHKMSSKDETEIEKKFSMEIKKEDIFNTDIQLMYEHSIKNSESKFQDFIEKLLKG